MMMIGFFIDLIITEEEVRSMNQNKERNIHLNSYLCILNSLLLILFYVYNVGVLNKKGVTMPETMTPTPTPEQQGVAGDKNPDVPKGFIEQGEDGEFKTSYMDTKPESKVPADFEAATGLGAEESKLATDQVPEVPETVAAPPKPTDPELDAKMKAGAEEQMQQHWWDRFTKKN
jgi:hypothetical protein